MGIFPGLVALLLVPLGGEANTWRSAVLHGAVSIPYSPPQKMGTILSVTWRFNKNGERVTILDTNEKPYYIYDSQFRDRLQISGDLFTLTIMDLTEEDTGIYTIDVIDRNGKTETSSFIVTIYEAVPNPSIRTDDVQENTTERCNVTLHCSAPSNASDFSYTWKHRLRISEYRSYNNGSSIQISLRRDSRDMEILCIAHNPADQKNVSIQVQDICKIADESGTRSHVIIIISILIVLLVIISVIIIWKKYTRKKAEPRENKNPETHYIEVITRRPESNERVQMENEEYIGMPSPQRTKSETVYSTVQLPQPKYKR